MKIPNPFKMISPTMQKMLLGGVVSSLSYWGTIAISEMAGYPTELKGKIAPQLPRYDEIIASVAPPAAMWVLAKKKPKLKDMSNGAMLYSLPHLIKIVAVNVAQSSTVPQSLQMLNFASPMRVPVATSRVFSTSQSPPSVTSPAATGGYR